ncbi:MAG: acyloxyacyl hydrolase [Bacteroidota bacterium]
MRRTGIVFGLLMMFAFLPVVKAQQLIPYFVSPNLHYGFIIPHRSSMQHLITGHFTGYEICIGKSSSGASAWQAPYHYPDYGLSFLYTNLGNDEVLGKAIGLHPYVNFSLHQGKSSQLIFRFGTGLGWITKPFDVVNNYKNTAIGSHLNALISFRFEERFDITEKIKFSTALTYTHMSNGAFKVPNLGINIPSVSTGITYKFGNKKERITNKKPLSDSTKLRFSFLVSGGVKEAYPEDGPKFPVLSSSLEISFPSGQKHFFGGGLDFFYDASIHEKYKQKMLDPGADILLTRVGVKGSYELVFSKLSFLFQVGIYALSQDKTDGLIYDRLALRYKLNKNLLINLSLKTHLAKADFIELGLGYSLHKSKKK